MYTPPPTGGGPARGPRWPLIGGLGCGGLIVLFVFFWVVGTIAGPPPEEPAKPAAAGSSPPASSLPATPTTATTPTPAAPTPTPTQSEATAPATPRPAASTPERRTAPRPTAEQQQVYLARVRLIDPALAAKPERDIRRARGICDRIINPPGGSISLTDYTIYMLSGPDVHLTDGQARQVIAAVQAWCR